MAEYQHHPHHVAVRLAGELSVPAVVDLVETVDMLVDAYHYALVEVQIASPGGHAEALERWLDAQRRWRAAGVRIRTRVVEAANSAGAILLSLGDERSADSRASLLYHPFRVAPPHAITAADGAAFAAELARLDDSFLDRLTDRALRDAGSPRVLEPRVQRSDRGALELLCARLPGVRRPARGRSARSLARDLERLVRRAVAAGDRRALAGVYRTLFHTELAISPAVALLLRLIDRVGAPEPPPAPALGPPGLVVPQWAALYRPAGHVPRDVLTRHTLALGDTGSGKTASVILPVVRALLDAPPGRVGAAFVVDPKGEIGPVVERFAPERLRLLAPSQTGLDLMAGPGWSLAGDLGARRCVTAAAKIVARVLGFDPTLPTRVLAAHQASRSASNAEFFDREGSALLLAVLAFVLLLIDRRSPPLDEWCPKPARPWLARLLDCARGGAASRGENALALAARVLDTGFVPQRDLLAWAGDVELPDEPPAALLRIVVRGAAKVWGAEPGEPRDLIARFTGYWHPMADGAPGQFAGVLASARVACSAIAEPPLATTLYFGCEPGAAGADGVARLLAHVVGRGAGGEILLYQPSRGGADTLVAQVLKAQLFEAVFSDPDRARGGADLPLLGYVADECHRFITSDPVHGEASFLDACRSAGVFCVLACQSMASIEHALARRGGGVEQDRAAVSIVWNNTASKLFFRSTDPRAADRVDDVFPRLPGHPSVTAVRPLSTLAPGECYAALADGRAERCQLDPVPAVLPERAPAALPGRCGDPPRLALVPLEDRS